MRNLFLALVLANLAFAAWTAWYADPSPAVAASPRETGAPIRLAREVPAADLRPVGASQSAGADSPAQPPTTEASGPSGVAARPDSIDDAAAPASSEVAASGPSDAAGLEPSESNGSEPSGSAASGRSADVGSPSVGGEPAARPAETAVAALDAAARCISIGPFADADDAEAGSEALRAAGYDPSDRTAEGEIWIGFWVHINAIPTREEANAMLAQLRENGLPDAYLIPGEEDGDIISLGVFNDMTRAGRLERQVREIGLVPVTVERSREALVHWLDVSVPAGESLDLAALGIRSSRVEQRPCAAAG